MIKFFLRIFISLYDVSIRETKLTLNVQDAAQILLLSFWKNNLIT